MKKVIILFFWVTSSFAAFTQNALREGDRLAASGNDVGAAMKYRTCIESSDECRLKLFVLIYEEKIFSQFSDELYQLIYPLAQRGNKVGQYYLGMLYKRGIGGLRQNDREAETFLQLSAAQGYSPAQNELAAMVPQQVRSEPKYDYRRQEEIRPEAVKGSSGLSTALFTVGGIAIAAGAASPFILPELTTENWNDTDETGTYFERRKLNTNYLIAGGIVGAVCIVTAVIVKPKKTSFQNAYSSEPDILLPDPTRGNKIQLNLVSNGNGAGLRLTF
jgi:hypothetical protein